MKLASIKSPKENERLRKIVNPRGKSPARFYWTGANDIIKEGSYKWADGTTFCYNRWVYGEPNNMGGSQHCGMYDSKIKEWYD